MIIQVQLSSKMWQKQLLFIRSSHDVFCEAALPFFLRTIPSYAEDLFFAILFCGSFGKIKNNLAVLYYELAVKALSVFGNKAAQI